ncbi:MAG: DUF885 domain-containing protein [Opitutaceae bacterium]|nr:DUF885 domain-containing protein [Cytophagales bacterium]
MKSLKCWFPLLFSLFLFSCNKTPNEVTEKSQSDSASVEANKFFEKVYDEFLQRHPIQQSVLGIRDRYSDWDDISDSADLAEIDIAEKNLSEFKEKIKFEELDTVTKVSYKLFVYEAEQKIAGRKFIIHNYPINQLFGWHSEIPSFLINIHTVKDKKDAEAYIERINKVPFLIDQVLKKIEARESKGIMLPKFAFAQVIDDCKGILKGQPFEFEKKYKSSSLLEDFNKKTEALKLPKEQEDSLNKKCHEALFINFGPAYRKLIAQLEISEKKATNEDGCWKFPDGEAFYKYALQSTTTTNLSPEEIFETGQSEVKRIQEEMKKIMVEVGFKGDLKSFFKYLQDDPKFYYPGDSLGKEAYMVEAKRVIKEMKGRLNELFITKPKADLIVKKVEPFREKSTAGAFYQEPAPDGSRPGIYYVNTFDMKTLPKYEIEALAYHEAIPGHHMQLAIAQEMKGLPRFRKYGFYTAYIEGWALYTELVPKEMGLYKDKYSDFGRLSMELLRAARLVVDVGIHSKKWTREEAIKYFTDNTPNSEYDCRKEIERYIVWPSQATAYKIGMLKILELREGAKKRLGEKFDIKEFHDVVLTNGAVPLNILEELVDEWVKSKL